MKYCVRLIVLIVAVSVSLHVTGDLHHEQTLLEERFLSADSIFTCDIDDNVYRSPQDVCLTSTCNYLATDSIATGSFPPDVCGAVGPAQFIVATNGLIKSFDKSSGTPDGALNNTLTDFFMTLTPNVAPQSPQVRYDRHSKRWIVIARKAPKTVYIAVSKATTITAANDFWFYQVTLPNYPSTALKVDFYQLPTLGVDRHALYIGGQSLKQKIFGFEDAHSYVLVIPKASLLSGGALSWSIFDMSVVIDPMSGSFSYTIMPQGVDNFDTDSAYGYFIGQYSSVFDQCMVARIGDPGGTPYLDELTLVKVPLCQNPIPVNHYGKTSRNLDAPDRRLMAAHIRNNRLWAACSVGVTGLGRNTGTITRNGCRWFELDVTKITGSSSNTALVQAGTLFWPTYANGSDGLNFWYPGIMTSGQGHMALGCSIAGPQQFYTIQDQVFFGYVNAATAGRLVTDNLCTTRQATVYTNSTTAYNPNCGTTPQACQNTFNTNTYAWGRYSYTSVDPCDDMTFWTIQSYCSATNTWGVRVAKLIAPPPATPIAAIPQALPVNATTDVQIIAKSINGSGFFEPGPLFDKHLTVTLKDVDDITVNSIQVVSPRELKLNITTGDNSGSAAFFVYNPDGQRVKIENFIPIGVEEPEEQSGID